MDKYKKGFAPILVLGAVVVAGAILFLISKNFGVKNLNFEVPYTSPTASQDPTADWKEYEFEPLGLTLKAPSDLFVETDEPNPGQDFTAFIQNYPANSPFPTKGAYQLYLVWQKSLTITDPEFQNLKDELQPNSIKESEIGGFQAIQGQAKGERNRFITYINKNGNKITLATSEPTEENRKLTDQILSTFKFTN